MSGNKRLTKVQPVVGFSSNASSKPASSVKTRSTVSTQPVPSNLIPPSVVMPLAHSKAKARSQEDLTKLKDRPKTKAPPSSTGTSNVRRPGSAKEAPKTEKLREKNKTSKSSSSSSSGRSSNAMIRKPKEGTKSKSDADKSNLEGKIKDLMGMAKTKDSEIRSLKTKLDHMMHLLNKQNDGVTATSRGEFTSLVKLADDEMDEDKESSVNDLHELTRLQDENMKLREQVETMMTSLKDKDLDKSLLLLHQHKLLQDAESLSTDDVSSIDDVASATSGDALRSLSRCTSADNLLDDVSTSGTTSSNGRTGCHADDCVSESSSVTVACLTERIHQMEESHISTNEELEATVQELTDLQKSVPELTIDNRRLQEEKEFLETKLQIAEKRRAEESVETNHLRALVSDRYNDGSKHSDLQQQYLILLNEREQLLLLHDSINKESRIAVREKKDAEEMVQAMQERMRHLERELNHSNTERALLDKKLKSSKGTAEEEQLKTLHKLEEELQLERQRNEKFLKTSQSEDSVELIDVLRHENQDLEEKCLLLEEGINQCQHENEKLDAKVAELEEEQEATNARTKRDLSELSELIDRLQDDLRIKQASLDEANDTLFVMEDSVEQHIAVKKHDNHIIQQLQNQISSLKEERFRLEKEIQQLKKEQRNQSEEWKQFQADLQMAVIIANDMKAETQSEVSRLRESNQLLDEQITKIRVENEQLRRKRISNVSSSPAAILEAAALRQSSNRSSSDIAALRENFKRRASENSPGVQTLIKSFDNQSSTGEPTTPTSPSLTPTQSDPPYSPVKSKPTRPGTTPMTATVSPLPRHQSMSAITISTPPASASKHHVNQTTGSPNNSSKPGTPESGRSSVSTSDLSQLSSLLRRNSGAQESRKASDTRKQPLTEILDRLTPTTSQSSQLPPPTSTPAKHRTMSISTPSSDPLASLARRYGGSKRNALLKWCQEKTLGYHGIDITNFSSSWSDGLALCALLHSYLPAHIPYDSLRQTYDAANDEGTRQQLQAKNFRLAFAAAESVGIDPTLTKEEMTTKERPDWQRVMAYVTQIYKYFET